MEITKDILEKLIWEDCDSRQKRMKVWTAIVGDALEKEEGPWELLYGLLFFAQSDFRRRRIFLSKTFPCFGGPPPETELDAMKMLFRLEERRREAYRKKNDGKEAKPLYLCGGHLEKWL